MNFAAIGIGVAIALAIFIAGFAVAEMNQLNCMPYVVGGHYASVCI